jgi:acyl dehydratase
VIDMPFFEDLQIGARSEIGSHRFTVEEIKAFAERYDPQPFHLDEAAAARSHFGGLVASGWHTAATWMRLAVERRKRDAEAARARGEPVAVLGPSPGFRDLKWLLPVYAGDTITYATEVVDKRVSARRPGWGLMHVLNTGTNQDGKLVLSFLSTAFIERRPA